MALTLAIVGATIIFTILYIAISRKRSIPTLAPDIHELSEFPESLPQVAGLTGATICEGNEARIYQNGDLFDALYSAIEDARKTVHIEVYIWVQGETSDRFADLLISKSRSGVIVRLLIDAIGSMDAEEQQLERMRESGVQVAIYHPVRRTKFRRFNSRTHRKLAIIDGQTAAVFGHGFMDTWRGKAQDAQHWRDTGVIIRGPLVCPLQVAFAHNWIEVANVPPLEAHCFAKAEPCGPVTGHVVSSVNRGGHSSVALLYLLAIASTKRELIIQNPYFAPDPSVVSLLTEVVDRGVKVHLMVPGKNTDSQILRRAGQKLYGRLLNAGVRIYIYEKTLLHQKIMIVDRLWSHIGSTNFDSRSLALNAELGIGMFDKDVAGQLYAAFTEDLKHCYELSAESWNDRSTIKKALDSCAYWIHGQI